jgi:hypothetical protein
MADANDPQAQASCPVTPDEAARIARDYEMKNAEAYVEIEITRDGYWNGVLRKAPKLNSHGTQEWFFALPFLYYGPWAVAIRDHRACYQGAL